MIKQLFQYILLQKYRYGERTCADFIELRVNQALTSRSVKRQQMQCNKKDVRLLMQPL